MLFSTGNFPRDGAPPPGVAMTAWTTRLPPERTRAYGVEELHAAWLLPRGFPGKGPVVSVSLPEGEMKFSIEIAGMQVLWLLGRPRPSVARSIKDACRLATKRTPACSSSPTPPNSLNPPFVSPRKDCRITNAPRWNAWPIPPRAPAKD